MENTDCRLKPSKISGVGIFAIKNIPQGKRLFLNGRREKWHNFKLSELKKLDKETMKMINDFFVIEKNKTVKIPNFGLNGMDISFFLNQSKKPNVKTRKGFIFFAARNIKKDEELTVSYADYDDKYKK